jgi:hypothetical protein
MIEYYPYAEGVKYKVQLLSEMPVGFENLTVHDIEQGVLQGKYEVRNSAGEIDPLHSTVVVDGDTGKVLGTLESSISQLNTGTWLITEVLD